MEETDVTMDDLFYKIGIQEVEKDVLKRALSRTAQERDELLKQIAGADDNKRAGPEGATPKGDK